jgi:hypothetical protein
MRLLKWITGCFVVLNLLMVSALWVGQTSPYIAASILRSQTCKLPCWHGIEPGKTTFQQARTLLQNDPDVSSLRLIKVPDEFGGLYDAVCWSMVIDLRWQGCALQLGFNAHDGSFVISDIKFTPPPDHFMMGDAMVIFDTPGFGDVCHPVMGHPQELMVSGSFIGFDPTIRLFLFHDTQFRAPFGPTMRVTTITLTGPYGGATLPPAWLGFKSSACLP